MATVAATMARTAAMVAPAALAGRNRKDVRCATAAAEEATTHRATTAAATTWSGASTAVTAVATTPRTARQAVSRRRKRRAAEGVSVDRWTRSGITALVSVVATAPTRRFARLSTVTPEAGSVTATEVRTTWLR